MAYFEYPYLDDEEMEIMESLNRGQWSPLSDADYAEHMAAMIGAARACLGLLPETNPEPPPRRRPLLPAELAAQLPADASAALPHLADAEREIFAAYRRGDPVAASAGRLAEILSLVLAALDTDAAAPPPATDSAPQASLRIHGHDG